MKSIIVSTEQALKKALKNKNINEIHVQNPELVKKLKIIRKIKKSSPWLIGAICLAIPLIPFTGGASLVPVFATSAATGALFAVPAATGAAAGSGVAITAIVSMCIAIGGTVLISLFTDWEEVEVANCFTLKRKRKE